MRRFSAAGVSGVASALIACSQPPAHHPAPTNWPAIDDAYIRAVAETMNFSLGQPVALAVLPDGNVLFRRTTARGRVADLYEYDSRTGRERLLLATHAVLEGESESVSAAEKARRERMRTATTGVVGISVAHGGRTVLVPLSGRLFTVERDSGAVRAIALPASVSSPFDPRLSPDGRTVAFVSERNLFVVATDGSVMRQLTTSNDPNVEFGTAEFVAAEEFDRARGFWWSPDSRQILVQRTDSSAVDTLYVSDVAHPDRAPTPFKYPRVGRPNAAVSLQLVDITSGASREVEWDHQRWEYLVRVIWNEDGPPLLLVSDRAQKELAVLTLGENGATTLLFSERDDAWVNTDHGAPRWLPGHRELLWLSEADGDARIEVRSTTGAVVRHLKHGDALPTRIDAVDAACACAWVTGSPHRGDATQSHVWKVPLDGGPWQAVRDTPGVHGVAVVDHGVAVTRSVSLAGGVTVDVHTANGGASSLPSVAESWPVAPTSEFVTVEASGQRFAAAITRPADAVPGQRYPVIFSVYGGPGARMVQASKRFFLGDQWSANAGFIVVSIDPRGTPGRGRDWERAIAGDFNIAVGDQVAALRALGARFPELDLNRVGVVGWSFGGTMAALLLTQHSDLFKAGIVGAPVTDWTLYDSAYTERYLGLPDQNPAGYANSNVLSHVDKLTRPMLVIHGITDDNVHLAHSVALIESLYRAGKRAEFVVLSATHMVPEPAMILRERMIQIDFFRQHLGAGE